MYFDKPKLDKSKLVINAEDFNLEMNLPGMGTILGMICITWGNTGDV